MKTQINLNVTSDAKATTTSDPGYRRSKKRRKEVCAFLTVVTAVGTVLFVPVGTNAFGSGVNLIVNGGFETGDLTGWLVYPKTDGSVTSAQAHNGTYSMEMEAVDIIYQDFKPTARIRAQELTFYAKLDRKWAGIANAIVDYNDGTSDLISFNSVTTTAWKEFHLLLHRNKVILEVKIELGESEPIYVDDVTLVRAP